MTRSEADREIAKLRALHLEYFGDSKTDWSKPFERLGASDLLAEELLIEAEVRAGG